MPTPHPRDPIAEARRQWEAHGWQDAAAGMAAVTSIMRAQQLMLSAVERVLKPYNLSFARFEMLRLLSFSREGSLTMVRASTRLQVHPTSVTNTVDRLERDELVRREPHPEDRRTTLIVITDAGRAVVEKATVALNTEVFSQPGLAEGDVTQLVRILTKLRKDSGDFAD
jgi:DNA-binding MarR family transcriptional regulator